MTPTESLQAAIDALERLKANSTPGPWEAELDEGEGEVQINAGTARTIWSENGVGRPAGIWKSTDRVFERDDLWDDEFDQVAADAELIETLHRTIDAQLSLLRHAEKFLGTVGHHTSNIAGPFIDDALTLADAILGTPALAEEGTPR